MWDEIFKAAASNGIWAMLFLGLLMYLLQDSRRREDKYTLIIGELSDRLSVVNDIRDELKDMKLMKGARGHKENKPLKVDNVA